MTLAWFLVSLFFGMVAMDAALASGSLWHWGALIGLYSVGGALSAARGRAGK